MFAEPSLLVSGLSRARCTLQGTTVACCTSTADALLSPFLLRPRRASLDTRAPRRASLLLCISSSADLISSLHAFFTPLFLITTTRYLLKTYKLTDGAAFNSNVSHAITRGHERGVFDLPKGFGGKVQIGSEKEVSWRLCSSSAQRSTRRVSEVSPRNEEDLALLTPLLSLCSDAQNETPSPPSKKRSTQTVLGSKKVSGPRPPRVIRTEESRTHPTRLAFHRFAAQAAPTKRKAPSDRKVRVRLVAYSQSAPALTFPLRTQPAVKPTARVAAAAKVSNHSRLLSQSL